MPYTPEQEAKNDELDASTEGSPISLGPYLNGEVVDAATWNTRQHLYEGLFTHVHYLQALRYTKPALGIPQSDLSNSVQVKLNKADTAYVMPVGGIPSSDMTAAVQTSLGLADTAYQKPPSGIPALDLAFDYTAPTVAHKNAAILDHPDGSVTTAKLQDYAVLLEKLREFGHDVAGSSGLNFKLLAGRYGDGNTVTDVASATVVLADNAVNYVEIDSTTATVTVNQTGFTAGDKPLWVVTTASGAVTTADDRRTWVFTGGTANADTLDGVDLAHYNDPNAGTASLGEKVPTTDPATGQVPDTFLGVIAHDDPDVGTATAGDKLVRPDPATGEYPLAAVPNLPISHVTGLQTALDDLELNSLIYALFLGQE